MSHVSDSDHCRLEAIVFPDCIVESHQISDASRGLRKVQFTKVWRTERILGRGGFGEVHLQSQDSDNNAKRALKVIPTRGVKLSLAECQRELTAMIEFTKPKYKDAAVFVNFHGWFQNDDAMFLAMEYVPLGDLEQNVQELEKSATYPRPALSEGDVQEITLQILEGLNIMHTEGFAHRDLKPQNVLVVQKYPHWWVKLGDFGLSKKRTDGTAYRTCAGTQEYMAPELFYYVQELDVETSEYTNAIDLWSLGCIVYRLMTGEVPFPSMLSLRNYCIHPAKVPFNMPLQMEEATKFVQGLLMPHPEKRLVASAALDSAWLTTKKKATIMLNDAESSFTALSISQSQNNYNTASHKGLQSYNPMLVTNHPPPNLAVNGFVSESLPPSTSESILDLLKVDAPLKKQKESKSDISHSDTIESHSELFLGAEGSIPSRYRSASQPAQPLMTELATQGADTDDQGEDGDDSDASIESEEVMSLRRKLRHVQRQFGEQHVETFGVMGLLATELKREKHGRAGRLEAEQLLVPALEFYKTELGATHPKTRSSMRLLAEIRFELGKIGQASKLRAELSEPQKRATVAEDTRGKNGIIPNDPVAHYGDKVNEGGNDEVIILDKTKRDGFWQAQRPENSSEGLVPRSYAKKRGVVSDPVKFGINANRPTGEQKCGIILSDFESMADDEVSVALDDEVIIINDIESEEWWWVRCIKNGKEGVVPSSYVEISGSVSNQATLRVKASSSTAEQNKLKEPQPPRTLANPGPELSRVRTWTDRSKKFTVEAELLAFKDGKIYLGKLNGVRIAVPADKISVEDLVYAEQVTRAPPRRR